MGVLRTLLYRFFLFYLMILEIPFIICFEGFGGKIMTNFFLEILVV